MTVAVGVLAWKGLTWLSDRAKAELDRIEAELRPAVTHASPTEARKDLARQITIAKVAAARTPELRGHAESVARLAATRRSVLGSFITPAEWKVISAPDVPKRTFAATVDLAAKRLSDANTAYVRRALVEAAAAAGFAHNVRTSTSNGRETTVFQDRIGRALVADVVESPHGAKLNLDLTGFGDGSCHPAMDTVLRALAERHVRLDHARRRSHYRREDTGAADTRRRLSLHATERRRVS
jgi:hypothetical protein